jgi:hypothetical protein
MATTHHLIQILLPTNGGDDGVFERLAQELTAKFGGVTVLSARLPRAAGIPGLVPSMTTLPLSK